MGETGRVTRSSHLSISPPPVAAYVYGVPPKPVLAFGYAWAMYNLLFGSVVRTHGSMVHTRQLRSWLHEAY